MFASLSRCQLRDRMLPTMPHDDISEARGGVRDARKWFMCKQGHAYAIGDCGQPVEVGKCPCGAPIGGGNYAFTDTGNNVQRQTQANLADQTRDGYILGPGIKYFKVIINDF